MKRIIERKKNVEKTRVETEEAKRIKEKAVMVKRKNEEMCAKVNEQKIDYMKQRGITKLPVKFHSLVGKYNNVLAIPDNGNCHCSPLEP